MAPIWTWALCQKKQRKKEKKKKWADTPVTEWDPCHDSVLAIGEQRLVIQVRWSTLWVLQGTVNKSIASFWHTFWFKERLSLQLLDALVQCWGFVHIIKYWPGIITVKQTPASSFLTGKSFTLLPQFAELLFTQAEMHFPQVSLIWPHIDES